MSKILELYKEVFESGQRFVDETFDDEIYAPACPKLTIIDAGAYEGEFSFYCLNFADKIYAFEPDPRPWAILKDRVERFNLGNKIVASNRALAGKSGSQIFGSTGYGGSRLMEKGARANKKGNAKIETISLADLFKEQGIEQVDIFKIDIEGGETELFKAPEFPELSKKIKLIIGEHLGESHELLLSLGYSMREVTGNYIYELTT